MQALIIVVRQEGRGPQVVISRAHRDYMAALFRREVPEVDDGVVQIMGVARDPGSRAKVAVLSRERDVDPVGACVGVRDVYKRQQKNRTRPRPTRPGRVS